MSQDAELREARGQIEELRKQLEIAAAKITDEHKLAQIGRLLASIVHEINTPIGSILSNNQVVARSLELLQKALANPQPAALEKAKEIAETLTAKFLN